MENKKCIGARAYKELHPQIAVRGAAFTLVEVILVVSLIGLLAAFMIPSIARGMRYRTTRDVAQKFQQAVMAFEEYYSDHGEWPVNTAPKGMVSELDGYYFASCGVGDWWTEETEIGGGWDWDWNIGGASYSNYAVVCIANPTIDEDQLLELDRLLDDGSLTNGQYQVGVIDNTSNDGDYGCILAD